VCEGFTTYTQCRTTMRGITACQMRGLSGRLSSCPAQVRLGFGIKDLGFLDAEAFFGARYHALSMSD